MLMQTVGVTNKSFIVCYGIFQSGQIADHVTLADHNWKCDNFEILARGRSDTHCKIKETLLIKDLKPSLNENVSSENFDVFKFVCFINMQISHHGSSIIYLIS